MTEDLAQSNTQPDPYESWGTISDQQVSEWITEDNIQKCNSFVVEGFEVIEHVDGKINENVEISFVRIKAENIYPQHIHKSSDAYFIITKGTAVLLSGSK